ncbi:hypothetical protein F4777DRAFT_558450, partial [Nemania sp. FL0916]
MYATTLEATNPRDYIYGILGMTKYPCKVMSLQEWMIARQEEIFIPLDYSLDLSSFLCIATWVLLMTWGPGLLIWFKAFPLGSDSAAEQALPSWVIDWHLTTRLFPHSTGAEGDNFIRGMRDSVSWLNRFLTELNFGDRSNPAVLSFCEIRQKFREANHRPHVPHNKLLLHGMTERSFYAQGTSIGIRSQAGDHPIWQLGFNVYPTDLIVSLVDFFKPHWGVTYGTMPFAEGQPLHGGLWVLRPAGEDEFTLVACLLWEPWIQAGRHYFRDTANGAPARQLYVTPLQERPLDLWSNLSARLASYNKEEVRTFTI